jgi:branched-chain amino acid aminotransferase
MSDCYIQILTPNGLEDVPYSASSLNEAAQYEPDDGVYTVTNTYNTTQVLKFDAHLERMENSARLANIPLKLDRARLRATLRQMILDSGLGDVRFRITVPRDKTDYFILSLEPYTPPPAEVYTSGVKVITAPDSARHNPAAKTTDWMHERQRLTQAMPTGIYDTILLDEAGNMLEGLASNFYAILNEELRTAGEGVLPGIAQQIVFEVAPMVLPLRKEAVNVREIPDLSEAFITSSSRGIVPVIEIDGHVLGDGKPGACTKRLREAYVVWVQAHLEEL